MRAWCFKKYPHVITFFLRKFVLTSTTLKSEWRWYARKIKYPCMFWSLVLLTGNCLLKMSHTTDTVLQRPRLLLLSGTCCLTLCWTSISIACRKYIEIYGGLFTLSPTPYWLSVLLIHVLQNIPSSSTGLWEIVDNWSEVISSLQRWCVAMMEGCSLTRASSRLQKWWLSK